ncbi:MAG TPA: molybdenum cofactor guanylyltransferase MobA [Steroidobacteraceae bacterium]|jgi:molybdopterin-guanine dinucleotide biosynthesis protein A|nr:molybdenum cofactor guanylyltransferase MobA [Steroidobacteraceae bacterium]
MIARKLMIIHRQEITGLILAGGRGTRMGGVDKGLQMHLGIPLAQHALARLRPQVGALMLNANRNLAAYQALQVPVWPDEIADFPGPLAGMLAGLEHCSTPHLITVPCDTPNFPLDLVAQLAQGLASSGGAMATAYTREAGELRAQPVFCLMKTSLRDALRAFIEAGERKTGLFGAQHHSAKVIFDDPTSFANANTLNELAALQTSPRPP